MERNQKKMDHVIGGKFKLGRKLGSGSFGELYLGIMTFLLFAFFTSLFMSLIFIFLFFFLKLIFDLLFLGINIQTGEEVAVKLVTLATLNFSFE